MVEIFHREHFTLWAERLMDEVAKRLIPSTYELYANLDWERAAREMQNPMLEYPAYYTVPHHGMTEGYLSRSQASAWEFIESLSRMDRVRPTFLQIAAHNEPQTIVDLGCGTATSSIQLAQMLPEARLTLVDLSPYELVAARCQAEHAGLARRTRYLHAPAEATDIEEGVADVVLASLLFHELPRSVAHSVVKEAWRLVRPDGHFIIFDPIQLALRWQWVENAINIPLGQLIHEVYWMDYMSQPVWDVCRNTGFRQVERRLLVAFPWVYQVITATK